MPERSHMVDAVNWVSLTRDPRASTGVPAALHALWSTDEFLRRSAYNYLAGTLVQQGSRFPVSIAAIPFLIDVIADPAAGDRFGACQLLRLIAIGDETLWLIERPNPAALRATPAPEQWDMAAYDAVRARIPAFLAALNDYDPAVRMHTAHLLSWFPEERHVVVPALTRVIESEPADSVDVAAVASVAAALAGGVAADRALTGALATRLGGPVPTERWAAAISVATLYTRPPREVIDQVYECLLEADDPVPNWPFLEGDMCTLAALALSRLDPSTGADRVELLIGRLRRTRPGQERTKLIGALVDAVFPRTDKLISRFTDLQLAAVRALIEADAWGDGPYVVSLLAAAGLPKDGRFQS
ncbi:hypothetical protein [Actinoplanes sp. NPDC026670]|uniref:hypothetical protein n=1 Tax=Actinoplanes sp. NPDC026670 TaxID=3154700 RepID=UPI0033E76A3E